MDTPTPPAPPPSYQQHATHAPTVWPEHPPLYSRRAVYPRHYEDSPIARGLAAIEQLLDASLGKSQTLLWSQHDSHENACAEARAWCAWRRELYTTVYPRTDDQGKQAIIEELSRITGQLVRKELSASELPSFGVLPYVGEDQIRRDHDNVLYASDGTIVAFLNKLYRILRGFVRHFHPTVASQYEGKLQAVDRVWVDRAGGCCPFWHTIPEVDRHKTIAWLQNMISEKPGILTLNAAEWLVQLENQGQCYRGTAEEHYAALPVHSLSHPLLRPALSLRKARIYGML